MLTFRDIRSLPIPYFQKYLQKGSVCGCEKTISCKRMWPLFHASFAETDGCLIVKNDTEFAGTVFDFPYVTDGGDVDAAMDELDAYCLATYTKLRFIGLEEAEASYVLKRYPRTTFTDARTYRDYIYLRTDLAEMNGKKYAGQRNHIHKFLSLYPDAIYRRVTNADRKELLSFLREWKKEELVKKSADAKREFAIDVAFVSEADFDYFRAGCVLVDGKVKAFCVGEKARDTVVIHAEKALHAYEGINVYLVREYAKNNPDVTYLNREDDAGEKGLRTSKTQYHPLMLLSEYFVDVKNELDDLKSIPSLKTPRLTLNGLKETDVQDYYRLCVDDERNKYWGYDYKKDLHGELTEDWFYQGAKRDFKTRSGLNFAIRKDGKLIGETVIFELDNKGECKIGARIFEEYAGHGYGTEAFEKTVDFALYTLGMKRVLSSCYKMNTASVKMHERTFRKIGEDDEKYYYAREY